MDNNALKQQGLTFEIKDHLLKARVDYRLIPKDPRLIQDETIKYVSDLLYRNPNGHINHRRLYRELNVATKKIKKINRDLSNFDSFITRVKSMKLGEKLYLLENTQELLKVIDAISREHGVASNIKLLLKRRGYILHNLANPTLSTAAVLFIKDIVELGVPVDRVRLNSFITASVLDITEFKRNKALLESKLQSVLLMRESLKEEAVSLRVSIKVLEYIRSKAT